MRKPLIVTVGLAASMFVAGAVFVGAARKTASPVANLRSSPDALAGIEFTSIANVDSAIATLQSRLRDGERNAGVFGDLGAAYLQKARTTADPSFFGLARRALNKSLQFDPTHLPSSLGMGQLALARHDFAAALRWGQRALSIDPHSATAFGIVGDAQVELGRYRAGFRSFQKMIDLQPSLASFARVSYARELTGDVDGAIAAMKRAIEAGGGVAENVAWATNQLGDLYFNSGRLNEAEREYRRARRAAPGLVPPGAGLGRIDAARGRLRAAIARYRAIVERYPSPQYVMTLGELYSAAGRDRATSRQHELVVAQERLLKSEGVLPDVELTHFFTEHAPKLALRLAREQYAERPSVRVADALAWALYANGRYERADRVMAEALELGTRDAAYHYHAGMIARALGDRHDARRHMSTARDINPYFSIHDPFDVGGAP